MSKGYHNVMEEIVSSLVTVLMASPDYRMFCNCAQCGANIIAASLNNLPPNYVTTSAKRDQVFNQYKQDEQIKWINEKIIQAIYSEGKYPRHLSD